MSATTGKPVTGASVTVSDQTTRTAQDGTFQFDKLPKSGQLQGSVVTSGFAPVAFAASSENADALRVAVPDATLRITVTERAREPKTPESYVLTIDGRTASADTTLEALSPGKHHLVLTGSKYLPLSTDATLKAGENTLTVSPSITATETYSRFMYDAQYGREKNTYGYVHPEERKRLSLKAWAKAESGTKTTSYKLGENRVLPKWKSKLLPTTFSNVVEIDRTYHLQVTDPKYSDYGQTFTDSGSQHWVMVDGIWYMVHPAKFW